MPEALIKLDEVASTGRCDLIKQIPLTLKKEALHSETVFCRPSFFFLADANYSDFVP